MTCPVVVVVVVIFLLNRCLSSCSTTPQQRLSCLARPRECCVCWPEVSLCNFSHAKLHQCKASVTASWVPSLGCEHAHLLTGNSCSSARDKHSFVVVLNTPLRSNRQTHTHCTAPPLSQVELYLYCWPTFTYTQCVTSCSQCCRRSHSATKTTKRQI